MRTTTLAYIVLPYITKALALETESTAADCSAHDIMDTKQDGAVAKDQTAHCDDQAIKSEQPHETFSIPQETVVCDKSIKSDESVFKNSFVTLVKSLLKFHISDAFELRTAFEALSKVTAVSEMEKLLELAYNYSALTRTIETKTSLDLIGLVSKEQASKMRERLNFFVPLKESPHKLSIEELKIKLMEHDVNVSLSLEDLEVGRYLLKKQIIRICEKEVPCIADSFILKTMFELISHCYDAVNCLLINCETIGLDTSMRTMDFEPGCPASFKFRYLTIERHFFYSVLEVSSTFVLSDLFQTLLSGVYTLSDSQLAKCTCIAKDITLVYGMLEANMKAPLSLNEFVDLQSRLLSNVDGSDCSETFEFIVTRFLSQLRTYGNTRDDELLDNTVERLIRSLVYIGDILFHIQ